MTVDGINGKPMTLKAALTVGPDASTSSITTRRRGQPRVNVPMCYTDAYTAFGISASWHPRCRTTRLARTIRTTGTGRLHPERPAPRAVAARSTSATCCPTGCSAA